MREVNQRKSEAASLEETILQSLELEEAATLPAQDLSRKIQTHKGKAGQQESYQYTFGDGMWEGLFLAFDPLGKVTQVVGQRLGYDIQTLGGQFTTKIGEEEERRAVRRAFFGAAGLIHSLGLYASGYR